jgi:hypothetical protein
MGDLMELIGRAWIGRVWLALGYQSWPDYIKGEFDQAPFHLPREERRAVAALLRGQGMSTRAIGAATGTDDKTVRNDLAAAENSAPAAPAEVTGLDGKQYPARQEPKPEPESPPKKKLTRETPGEEAIRYVTQTIVPAIDALPPWLARVGMDKITTVEAQTLREELVKAIRLCELALERMGGAE